MKTKNSILMSLVTPKRLGSPRANLFIALSVLAALFSLQPAHAQESNAGALTKAEQQQMQVIMKTLDEKIKAGFKGQEALQTDMSKELQRISSLKDSAEQKKAAATYQAKYLKSYSGVLSKAGVDLSGVAKEFQGVARRFNFLLKPDLSIVGIFTNKSSPLALPPAGPTSKTTRIDQFVDHKQRSCALAAGGDVTFTSSSVTTSAGAAVAGGCSNSGDKSATVAIPAAATSAQISVRADLSAEAFAVGVVGTSGANAGASFSVSPTSHSVSVVVIAPILWVAFADESLDGQSINVELAAGSSNAVRFGTSAHIIAAIAGGNSKAKVKNISVSLTVTQ